MSRLNLEDRQSWQRFQRILTSFISDYIDLLAPEQTEIRVEAEALSLAFTLISPTIDQQQVNQFTHQLERYLIRLELVGIRQVAFLFSVGSTEEILLSHRFPVTFFAPEGALATRTDRPAPRRRRGGSLVRRFQGWLVESGVSAALQNASKVAIRHPKGALIATGAFSQRKFSQAITWVDTFPWEEWTRRKVQWQKRRHSRNLWKALIEDIAFISLIASLIVFGGSLLSGAPFDLATLPAQHYDRDFIGGKYACGPSGVTRKNYVCLQRGMSYNQVSKILGSVGKPLGIDPKFGNNLEEVKKELTTKEDLGIWSWFNRQPAVGERTAIISSWSDGKNGKLNATFRNNRLVARAYRNIS